MQKDLDMQKRKQKLNRMFGEPNYSSKQEYVVLTTYFLNEQNKYVQGPKQRYVVKDLMMVKQLLESWKKNNGIKIEPVEEPKKLQEPCMQQNDDFYNFSYRPLQSTHILVWRQTVLQQHMTIMDVKQKIGKQKLTNNEIIIHVYKTRQCKISVDQAAIDLKKYQQKVGQIQLSFKLEDINGDPQKTAYFYMKCRFGIEIGQLEEKVKLLLQSQNVDNPLQKGSFNKNLDQFSLCLSKKSLSECEEISIMKQISQLERIQQIKYQQVDGTIQLSKFKNEKVRMLCPPGHIIQLRLKNPQKIKMKKPNNKFQYDPLVKIICYEQINQKNNNVNSKLKIKKNQIQKRYSRIRQMKVSTILKQYNIQEPLLTSLLIQTQTIRPFELFKKLDDFIISRKFTNDSVIRLIGVPQNFLFYKQLNQLQYTKKFQQYEQWIKHLISLNKNFGQQRNKFETLRQQKISSNKIEEKLKKKQIIQPLLIYTSQLIYSEFNRFLRQNSVALEENHVLTQKWYPFCQKLMNSLIKLPNYRGFVYRGSKGWDYNYSKGDVIQWNSFSSTSKIQEIAWKFLLFQDGDENNHIIFEIQTYSGKFIDQFSQYQNQELQVLLLPYTRFKVMDIKQVNLVEELMSAKNKKILNFLNLSNNQLKFFKDQNYLLKKIKLLQLPIPKKIPGHIVIWIDPYIQKSKEQQQHKFKLFMFLCEAYDLNDFDLIQLQSNEHFIQWLKEFKHILELRQLRQSVKLHFITNLNRPPNYNNQGIETLRIIRQFDKEEVVVFYIGNKYNAKKAIEKTQFKNQIGTKIKILDDQFELHDIFTKDFLSKSELNDIQQRLTRSQIQRTQNSS